MSPSSADVFDSLAFRRALGRYATGVAIVAAYDQQGKPFGMTINSFASVSLEPPLILWSVESGARMAPAYIDAPLFGLSVLAADQEPLARRFADPDLEPAQRFDHVALDPASDSAPLLAGSAAWFECRRDSVHPGGDHEIILGRVLRFGRRAGRTLLFHDGAFHPGA
ncbi:MAG: flavin reductase family protein [Rhodothalassiaceae bacterium]